MSTLSALVNFNTAPAYRSSDIKPRTDVLLDLDLESLIRQLDPLQLPALFSRDLLPSSLSKNLLYVLPERANLVFPGQALHEEMLSDLSSLLTPPALTRANPCQLLLEGDCRERMSTEELVAARRHRLGRSTERISDRWPGTRHGEAESPTFPSSSRYHLCPAPGCCLRP